MTALFHTPLTAPREHMGFVDGSRDRETPCPRTLAQAFGDANAGGVIVPMADPQPSHRAADKVLYVVGVIGIAAALVFNNWSPL